MVAPENPKFSVFANQSVGIGTSSTISNINQIIRIPEFTQALQTVAEKGFLGCLKILAKLGDPTAKN